jgi:hypothetical protein
LAVTVAQDLFARWSAQTTLDRALMRT